MKPAAFYAALTLVLASLPASVPPPAPAPVAVRAWFTDAVIANSAQTQKPAGALPLAGGTNGTGVELSRSMPVENPIYDPGNGMISFWLRPHWNGNDGKTHIILRIGDPGSNGLLLEKAGTGMLRYVVSSPKKTTAARWNVSGWKAGEWHYVAISWITVNNRPVGLPLWVDRVCVDGPIFGGSEFPSPTDTRVWIGDVTSDAAMDELICRTKLDVEGFDQPGIVYRDYFRAAPFKKIAIDLHPHYGPMDPRVAQGCQKQFGLLAERAGKWEKVTDFAVRYNQWSYYDARPFIRWTTSDPNIATVDKNGRVTGKATGACILDAAFRGMKASYRIEVIPIEQPDLDLVYVERLPKYDRDAAKNKPAPGDRVQSVAHIINFGYITAPAGSAVMFQLIPDRNRNFRLDPDEKPVVNRTKVIDRDLMPREEVSVTFDWAWTEEPAWVRVAVDPMGKFDEICSANNERCELNIARPLEMAVDRPQMESFYRERKINHIGSFSEYDWTQGQLARFEAMMRSAVYPATSPDGVRDSFRIDRIYVTDQGKTKWDDEPYARDERFYDGGFPVREPIDLMAVDAAILHEYGHTCASLPDLYGYGVAKENVFLKDAKGDFYAGGDLMPVIRGHSSMLPFSSANNVPCGAGLPSLMDHCSLWLAPFEAGQIQWFAGYRGPRFWAVQDHLLPPFENHLRVYDANDQPLKGAAVYVYAVINTNTQDAEGKYFADAPKFIGHTDEDGRFKFPHETDAGWDDPDTDAVEGSMYVEHPFARVDRNINFTPNVWTVEGLLLVKIVSGDQTEFSWLPLTEFNRVFFEGNRVAGTIPVRTSLKPSGGETPIVRPAGPVSSGKVNLRPAAAVDVREMTVKCGQEFTINGSKSSDPEGKPLTYCWVSKGGGVQPERAWGPVLKARAPDSPGEAEYVFYVIDGLRCSEPVSVRVKVVK